MNASTVGNRPVKPIFNPAPRSRSIILTFLAMAVPTVAILAVPLSAHGMYDPKHGRWLQRDPLGVRPDPPGGEINPHGQYTDGMSLYEYVKSSPGRLRDPSGRAFMSMRVCNKSHPEPGIKFATVGDVLKQSPSIIKEARELGPIWQKHTNYTIFEGCTPLDGGKYRCGYVFGWRWKCPGCCTQNVVQHVIKYRSYFDSKGNLVGKQKYGDFIELFGIHRNGISLGIDEHYFTGDVPAEGEGVPKHTKRCIWTQLIACCGNYDGRIWIGEHKEVPNSDPSKMNCCGKKRKMTINYCFDASGNSQFNDTNIFPKPSTQPGTEPAK